MRLHLLGLPHTISHPSFSHCAFTGKVQRFPSMMKSQGYEVIHYGVEGAETEAAEHVTVMTRDEQNELRGHNGSDPSKFFSDDANSGTKLYAEYNKRLRRALCERVTQADLVLLPFGHGHEAAVSGLPFTLVESGIGYPTLYSGAALKIFESYAWLHWHLGKRDSLGKNYEWVIPNYFDARDWDVAPELTALGEQTVVFLGRLIEQKGLATVVALAKERPDIRFVICGQGDPAPYLTESNIEYRQPVEGRERSVLLGDALAVLTPTQFTEPFGGVAVEAMMCGTPVLTTPFGAFTETVEDQVTGFRCHTLGDFLAGLSLAPTLDRRYIAARARALYGYARVGKMYDRAFQQIADLSGPGWYTTRSSFPQMRGAL